MAASLPGLHLKLDFWHNERMNENLDIHGLLSVLAEPFTAEQLFDQLNDIVFFVKNAAGQYVCVNATLVERCNRKDKAELLGRTPSQVLGEGLGASYEQQDRAILESGERLVDELELHSYPSREVGWCLTSKFPLLCSAGGVVGVVGISRDLKVQASDRDEFDQIAAAIHYAELNLASPPSLDELAAIAGLSKFQLDRRMKRIFGLPTGQWLVKARIELASRQLRDTELPIAEIAFNAGYADQSAFTRQFRRAAGMTPSRFRQLQRS
jgi:AraC-like DNA-binding protein